MKTTRSLLRAFGVLEALADNGGPAGPAALGAATGLDKATVARLLATCCEAGYLSHDAASGHYWFTGRVLRLSRAFLEHGDLRSLARAHLTALRDDTGETVHLGRLDGRRVVYIDKLESASSVRLVSSVGQTMPVHTTSLGKAMLSAMDDQERDRLLEGADLTARTPHSITTREGLLADLRTTARRGWSTDLGENEDNVRCVGAVLRDAEGRVVGAVSVSGPAFRVGPKLAQIGERCRRAAEEISAELPLEDLPSPRSAPAPPAAEPGAR